MLTHLSLTNHKYTVENEVIDLFHYFYIDVN